jgi:hypothetical protein
LHIQRWIITRPGPNGSPRGVDGIAVNYANVHHFEDGDVLVKADFHEHDLVRVQSHPDAVVLPSLHAPCHQSGQDCRNLHPRLKQKLDDLGITPGPNEVILNVLRKLRNSDGAVFEVNSPF